MPLSGRQILRDVPLLLSQGQGDVRVAMASVLVTELFKFFSQLL